MTRRRMYPIQYCSCCGPLDQLTPAELDQHFKSSRRKPRGDNTGLDVSFQRSCLLAMVEIRMSGIVSNLHHRRSGFSNA